MAGRLQGKTAIVTSAGQGIGRASAICMAKEGAKVWATDINAEALASLAAEQSGIETFTLDVLKQDQVDAAAARVGTPDILFAVLDVYGKLFDRALYLRGGPGFGDPLDRELAAMTDQQAAAGGKRAQGHGRRAQATQLVALAAHQGAHQPGVLLLGDARQARFEKGGGNACAAQQGRAVDFPLHAQQHLRHLVDGDGVLDGGGTGGRGHGSGRRSQHRAHGLYPTTLRASRVSMAAGSSPVSDSTSRVCWPCSGAGQRTSKR